jgi:heptaprenyl diphosphate synthase
MADITIIPTEQDHKIAKLTAIAITLHLLESAFPSPIPGVKPGVANIITLYVLTKFGIRMAAWVSLLRVFASSLLLGQFLTPSFFLSLAGASVSLIALAFANHLPKHYFSAISLSVIAAIAHISGQLFIVRYWLIPSASVVYLMPIFMLAALFFGCINGLITEKLLRQTKQSS